MYLYIPYKTTESVGNKYELMKSQNVLPDTQCLKAAYQQSIQL